MRLPRLSIAALMGVVLSLAVAFAALAQPTPLWAALAFSGVIAALTFALLALIILRGSRRRFWLGFFVGGSTYLFLHYGPYCDEHISPYTLPTALVDLASALLNQGPRGIVDATVTIATPPPPYSPVIMPAPAPAPVLDVAHMEPPPLPPERSPFSTPGDGGPVVPATPPSSINSVATVPPTNPPPPPAFVADTPYVTQDIKALSPISAAWQYWSTIDTGSAGGPTNGTTPTFFRIGHSFLSLFVAIMFGLVARRLGEKKSQTVANVPSQGSEAPATLGA